MNAHSALWVTIGVMCAGSVVDGIVKWKNTISNFGSVCMLLMFLSGIGYAVLTLAGKECSVSSPMSSSEVVHTLVYHYATVLAGVTLGIALCTIAYWAWRRWCARSRQQGISYRPPKGSSGTDSC